jgi:hypothetical protein
MAEGFGLYGALAGRRGHLEFVNLARHRVPSHSARALAASERLSASVCFCGAAPQERRIALSTLRSGYPSVCGDTLGREKGRRGLALRPFAF